MFGQLLHLLLFASAPLSRGHALVNDGPSLQKALQSAIERGDHEFSIPVGNIYFNSSTFSIVGASGMRISGAGPTQTTLWFSPGAGVHILRCHNITLKGFSIDYDPLPYTQATIVAIANVTSTTAVYDLELAPRSPPLDRNCSGPTKPPLAPEKRCERYGITQLWGPNGSAIAGSDFGLWPGHDDAANAVRSPGRSYISLPGGRVRSTFGVEPVPASVGDVITTSGRDWFTYTIANSSKVITEDMNIYSSSGFTMMELDGVCGHTYRRVVVAPKPGYLIASSADVFHSADCLQGALIEDCLFETNLDDFLNVHSTVHILWNPPVDMLSTQLGPNEHFLLQGQDDATAVSPSDVTGYWYGTSNPVKNLVPTVDTLSCYELNTQKPLGSKQRLLDWPVEVDDPTLVAAAKALGDQLRTSAGLNPWAGVRVYRIRLEGQLGNSTLDVPRINNVSMCDLDRFNGAGLIVRNNVFRQSGHPQCGARIKSSHSVIENNQWIGNAFLNLESAFLQSWLEGPTHIHNVTFRNELIINCTAGPPPRTDIFGGVLTNASCMAAASCPYNITYESRRSEALRTTATHGFVAFV